MTKKLLNDPVVVRSSDVSALSELGLEFNHFAYLDHSHGPYSSHFVFSFEITIQQMTQTSKNEVNRDTFRLVGECLPQWGELMLRVLPSELHTLQNVCDL